MQLSRRIFSLFPQAITLELLLSQGVDVESRNPRGSTPERERFRVLRFGKKHCSYPFEAGFEPVVRSWNGPVGRSRKTGIKFLVIETSY